MIERLQKGSTEAVNAMTASREGAEKSVQQIHSSTEDLQQMAAAMAEIYAMSHQIARAMDEQGRAIAEVTGNLAVIRDISEQTSGQSAAAATDSGRLSAMAKDLRGLLKQFRVGG